MNDDVSLSNHDGDISSIIYSCSNLHIEGLHREAVSKIDYEEASKYPLVLGESLLFHQNGYFIMKDAVDLELIKKCRLYVDENYISFLKKSKRCDDWRLHFVQSIDCCEEGISPTIDHIPVVNLLLKSPKIIGKIVGLMGRQLSGIFYSQIALRTPVSKQHRCEYYVPGAEYHIDGQANNSGERFPDHWTIQIGIALVDIDTKQMGNFTVFPGFHSSIKWNNYCHQKITKTLPHLGDGERICLKAGDCIFCHVLLPHRGGKNITDPTSFEIDTTVKNIPKQTREMIFIRVRGKGIDYNSVERSISVIDNPWVEYEGLLQTLSQKS